MHLDKTKLTEQDICTKFITPAIVNSGWDKMHQVREQVYFTDGKVIVRGRTVKRGERKRADYILYYKSNLPLAIIEAKANKNELGSGMQQGQNYAEILDIPFVYSSNGDGFIEHDRTKSNGVIERELSLDQFPTPGELYNRYLAWKGLTKEAETIITQEYFFTPTGKRPRYYQEIAINRAVEAIAKGQQRVLITMATGTGKTYTAFQIMWRLWKSRSKKRILFLADRNVLVDDPMKRDFAPFRDKMVKLNRGKFDIEKFTAYEIFVGIYQSATGTEEEQKIFKQFPADFFDLIIIDECHRGSASEDSAWREILEYYSSATQIGMTATPKETKEVSNIDYFGEPIYTYSLKQGIEDGFLAPYKVIRITLDKDVEGYRPSPGKTDKYGNIIEDREYNIKDYDKKLVIDERTKVVAKKVTEFLRSYDRFAKTIIFCVDIDHAERMRRALINENADLYNQHSKYIMRITGDSEEGKNELDNFIDPEKKFPVIVTTSKLLTTGVDAKTCKLIVLDTNINSIIEFKQIVGRGTRLDEEFDKYYFTIMDFRQATKHFADPNFDGEPVQIYEPEAHESPIPPEDKEHADEAEDSIDDSDENLQKVSDITIDENPDTPKKYYIDGVNVQVINETVQFYGDDGKLTTESVREFSRNSIIKQFRTLSEFLQEWRKAESKAQVIAELESHGVLFEELQREVGRELDPFDMVLHIAFDKPPLTRKERALQVKKRNYFEKYGEKVREILEAILEKYSDEGIPALEDLEILKVNPLNQFGKPVEILNLFGGKEEFEKALDEMEEIIYQ